MTLRIQIFSVVAIFGAGVLLAGGTLVRVTLLLVLDELVADLAVVRRIRVAIVGIELVFVKHVVAARLARNNERRCRALEHGVDRDCVATRAAIAVELRRLLVVALGLPVVAVLLIDIARIAVVRVASTGAFVVVARIDYDRIARRNALDRRRIAARKAQRHSLAESGDVAHEHALHEIAANVDATGRNEHGGANDDIVALAKRKTRRERHDAVVVREQRRHNGARRRVDDFDGEIGVCGALAHLQHNIDDDRERSAEAIATRITRLKHKIDTTYNCVIEIFLNYNCFPKKKYKHIISNYLLGNK